MGRLKGPRLFEQVAKRRTDRNVVAEVISGKRNRGTDRPHGITMTVSFTIDTDTDMVLHRMALQQNTSRSAIVRAAVQRYAYDNLKATEPPPE